MTDAGSGREPGAADAARHERLDALLNARVAPRLAELRAKQRWKRPLAAALGLGGPALAWLLISTGEPLEIILGLHSLLLGPTGAWYLAHLYRKAARDVVTPVVCEAIGGLAHATDVRSGEIGRLHRALLVSRHNQHEIDDVFEGSHAGVAFLMMELTLSLRTTRRVSGKAGRPSRTETRTRTIFRGLFFMIATPRTIPVPILIRGRRWLFGTPWRLRDGDIKGMQRIDIPDEAFARRLSLWTSDWERAAEVITPAFAAVMARLAATAGRRGIDAAFDRDQFLLLLPRRGDQFKVGGLFRSVRRLRVDAHRLMDEILMVHRLIETLKGD